MDNINYNKEQFKNYKPTQQISASAIRSWIEWLFIGTQEYIFDVTSAAVKPDPEVENN